MLLDLNLDIASRKKKRKNKFQKTKTNSLPAIVPVTKKKTNKQTRKKKEKKNLNPQHVHHIYISERKTCIYTSVFPPFFHIGSAKYSRFTRIYLYNIHSYVEGERFLK